MKECLMDGVTILSQRLDYSERIIGIVLAIIFLALFILMFCCFAVNILGKNKNISLGVFTGVVSILCGLTVMLSVMSALSKPITEYKVTISDDVNFKEFYERYEVIDQNWEIYTIVEKEK